MQRFTAKIVDMMKQEKLYASQGGPIILSQVGICLDQSLFMRCLVSISSFLWVVAFVSLYIVFL